MTLRQAQIERGFGAAAAGLAGAAAQLLGWRPDEFWGATPMELASALSGGADNGVDRERVDALRAQFPD